MAHSAQFLKLVNESKTRVKETNVEDVKRRTDAGEKFLLVDVREDNEWANGHLPRAVHLGRGIIERDIEMAVPDTGTKIILYCGGGFRSALVADNLQDGRRLEGLGGGRAADYKRLDPVLNRSEKSTIVACLNMPCTPSLVSKKCLRLKRR